MLDKGLCITLNSDDPAFFGGYLNENFEAVTAALNLNRHDIHKLVQNSINASFLNDMAKAELLRELEKGIIVTEKSPSELLANSAGRQQQ